MDFLVDIFRLPNRRVFSQPAFNLEYNEKTPLWNRGAGSIRGDARTSMGVCWALQTDRGDLT